MGYGRCLAKLQVGDILIRVKIKIQQFLYQNHSWSIVGWNLARSFMNMGHEVCLVPTDKNCKNHLPKDLLKYETSPSGVYDMQLSYTALRNFPEYLSFGDKNRFGIWNYEYRGKNLLPGFAKYVNFADKVLPSSDFSKDVFLDMNVPASKLVVVPHGIHLEQFKNKKKYPLKTEKKYKILLNVAQIHKRKNIKASLEAFGRAFTKDDDVCLVAKITLRKSNKSFTENFQELFNNFKNQFPNHAEIEIVSQFVDDIVEIYNACDINFSTTFAECWHLPSLEAMAAGLINIVPNYGGQLHFCNDNNSLLISGKTVRAPKDHQYWMSSPYAYHFMVDIPDAVTKLQTAVHNFFSLRDKMLPHMKHTTEKFTWDSAAKQIIDLCN